MITVTKHGMREVKVLFVRWFVQCRFCSHLDFGLVSCCKLGVKKMLQCSFYSGKFYAERFYLIV